MSQGCNFINTLMTASRRRSASVNPGGPASNLKVSESNQGRRASSSSELAQPNISTDESIVEEKTPRTSVCLSNDTIKPCETLKSTDSELSASKDYIDYSQMQKTMQPLQVDIESSPGSTYDGQYIPIEAMCNNHPISLDEIYQIDMDNLRLEDECKNLEQQVKYWEDKVDDLERKRCGEDAPRTLVEKVLKQRKKLREIELQIFKLNLESSEESINNKKHFTTKSDLNAHHHLDYDRSESQLADELISADNDDENEDGLYTGIGAKGSSLGVVDISSVNMERQAASKFGSHIKPGQENTADILDAIPPSGSLQYRQYLNKASSGTDSGDYSQQPMFDQRHLHHQHILPHAPRRHHPQHQHYLSHHQYHQVAHNLDDSTGSSHSTRGNLMDEQAHNHYHNYHHHHHNHHHHHQQHHHQQHQQHYKSHGMSQHDNHYRSNQNNNQHNRNLNQNQAHLLVNQQQPHKSSRIDQEDLYVPYGSLKGISDDSSMRNSSIANNRQPASSHQERNQPSPVRPSHFEGMFKPAHTIMHDSSSTTSSSSPPS